MKLDLSDIVPKVLGKSQKGQDSLIEIIFEKISTTNKYYVEFGGADGVTSCNTWYFKNMKGWSGLLLDCDFENPAINLHRRHLTKENICSIFSEFKVPIDLDFLCVDIDGMDYWLLKEILSKYTPRVLMVETNVRFAPYDSKVLKYDADWRWDAWRPWRAHADWRRDGRKWYGGSPYAFKKLLNSHGYDPIHIHLDDMLAVRKDVLEENGYEAPSWESVYSTPNIDLYKDHTGRFNEGIIAQLDTSEWEEVV